ncbi:MAG: protein kinase [Deltaproteobacteria bacterium]|nr:protein kinase [Deltaproteobacteria bacterium]MBW2497312.1 protein kinase [Deltaproteobacteria bacterium]
MRILARIFAWPIGLLGVAAGILGLLLSLGSESGPAAVARRGLRSLVRWGVNQGWGLPRDLATTTEQSLAGLVPALVLMLVGLVSLAYAAGLFGGGSRIEAPPGPDEARGDGAEGARPDKRAGKKILKQARALKKQGEILEAAELLWSHEQLDEAAAWFIEAGEYVRAAEVRHDQNRFLESAELHMQGENYESAGSIFGQAEDWSRAADCYLKAGHKSVAAEMFEKAGDHRQAAHCYRETDFLRHAAANYVKCHDWKLAADCLESVIVEEGGRSLTDPKKAAEMSKLVRQAGKLFMKAGEPIRALEILVRGECRLEAAEVAASLGDHEAAAQHFRAAGEVERAADSLRELGEEIEAARLLGHHLRDGGDNERAARLLEEAGDFMEAGDLYRSLERFEEAGVCYERHHGYGAAAEMFQLAGDRARAGEAFERAGRFTESAECFALAGLPQREAELLEKAGDFLRSGETYHREGLDEEAISVLQKVPQEDEDFARAAAILGDIFAVRGQIALAITKLQQALGDMELGRDSVDGFYKLASLYLEEGKAREAAEIFEKVMAFDYHYRDVEARLAEAREFLGDPEPVNTVEAVEGAGARFARDPDAGRYQIVGELGRGGMGIVYKVQDTVLDRLVAFKVLPQAVSENPQAVANFMREAQAAAKLNHPNIVTVYDTGEQQGRYYIAMEYVEGTTLKEILRRRGPISPAGILHVLVQVAEALAYAHDKKVVHRDIKPANVMWARDKKAKLMDFGLAKVVAEARDHTTVVAGTPYYMSPEQTLGKNIDHRTDIYSLGVTLFELATGTVPFKEGNIPYHHVHTAPPDVRTLSDDLPALLAEIIARCLEKDPADRFQSAKEILDAVRRSVAAGSPASSDTPS